MKRIATIVEGGKVVGLVHGPDEINQSLTVGGRVWRFDFDDYFGPLWTNKDGSEKSNQNPPKTVWVAFEQWLANRKHKK